MGRSRHFESRPRSIRGSRRHERTIPRARPGFLTFLDYASAAPPSDSNMDPGIRRHSPAINARIWPGSVLAWIGCERVSIATSYRGCRMMPGRNSRRRCRSFSVRLDGKAVLPAVQRCFAEPGHLGKSRPCHPKGPSLMRRISARWQNAKMLAHRFVLQNARPLHRGIRTHRHRTGAQGRSPSARRRNLPVP